MLPPQFLDRPKAGQASRDDLLLGLARQPDIVGGDAKYPGDTIRHILHRQPFGI